MDILSDLKSGKRRAIARAISIIENDDKTARQLIKKIFKNSGKSITIGITGPAGAGKSTLIDRTVLELKKLGYKAAVLAIDNCVKLLLPKDNIYTMIAGFAAKTFLINLIHNPGKGNKILEFKYYYYSVSVRL